jgi:hypothetical protein
MREIGMAGVLTSIVQPSAYIGRVVAYGTLELEGVEPSVSVRSPLAIGSTGAPRILPGSGIKKVRNRKRTNTFREDQKEMIGHLLAF